jgi:RimJ/RimL family protein N-acetyltransferase
LRHEVRLEGPAFRLRPVAPDDAAEILRLRSDPSRSRFIHATAPSVEEQRRWLEAYLDRDGDLYWAVERHDGDVEGFVGLYDVEGPTAEWGRWVLRPGSLAAPESAWLVHQAGFTVLGLDALFTRTLVENRPVVAFHARYGAEVVQTIPRYAQIHGEVHDALEARMTAALWSAAGPRLLAMAERAAGLVRRTAPGRPAA